MDSTSTDRQDREILESLKIHCERCSGLCCVALYCAKTEGFPADKEGGEPCRNLQPDFRCSIHAELSRKNMRGCLAYDCFGAGQKVTEKYGPGQDWKSSPENAAQIFSVFLTVFQLHQIQWYLCQAGELAGEPLQGEIRRLIDLNEQMTAQSPAEILGLELEGYREKCNGVLKQVCAVPGDKGASGHQKDFFGKNFKGGNLDGRDFSMGLLIGAKLDGCSLRGTNFLGADMRGVSIQNTDLRSALFLTQMQINGAKGNGGTQLPPNLTRPDFWPEG